MQYDMIVVGARCSGSPTAGLNWQAAGLTSRECEVAALVARGLRNREIAQQLVISEKTAKNHVHHVLDKLGARSRAEVAAHAEGCPVVILRGVESLSDLQDLSLDLGRSAHDYRPGLATVWADRRDLERTFECRFQRMLRDTYRSA